MMDVKVVSFLGIFQKKKVVIFLPIWELHSRINGN